jgi:hypothetical protein
MIERCYNPHHIAYANYGGRGIGVCRKWRYSFENFIEDMGERPPGMTLDRIDNDHDYGPGNCRWATRAQQALNTRQNRFLSLNGKTQTVREWANELGMRYQTLHIRLWRGWPLDRALKPLDK